MDAGLISAVQRMELEAARAAIDALPPRQREVLEYYLDNKGYRATQRELADRLGISENNFQLTLTRAGKDVCKSMKDSGFDVLDRPDWGDVG